MNSELVRQIADAVLYEGYMLYPYRRSAIKNQHRWNFGVLYPRAYAEAQSGNDTWTMQTECLALFDADSKINLGVRFLHLVDREIGKIPRGQHTPDLENIAYEPVPALELESGEIFQSWQEAREREINVSCTLSDLESSSRTVPFSFAGGRTVAPIHEGGDIVGIVARHHHPLAGVISLAVRETTDRLCKLQIRLANAARLEGADRERALRQSLLSAHIVIAAQNGEFISLLDPPDEFRAAAAACRNIGCWPVLVGTGGERDTMLASPIILYDYPQVAAQSAGDLFDGTEIDEILSLRIMTLTDEEKREMATSDERAQQILRRTEAMPIEQFMKLHGVMRR
jgi:hydrogenase maturation protease